MAARETTRSIMARVCDLVGVPPISPLKGETEPAEFFEVVADRLGVERRDEAGHRLTKPRLARAIVETAGLAWDPAWDGSLTPSGGGGSVTNAGLLQVESAAIRVLDNTAPPPPTTGSAASALAAGLGTVAERMVARQQRERLQRERFRAALLAAYSGRCAVTGTDWDVVLEAAHINPFKDSLDNSITNGILLRADIHALFDRHVLLIHPASLEVVFHPAVTPSAAYAPLAGTPVTLPADPAHHPDPSGLIRIWERFGPP